MVHHPAGSISATHDQAYRQGSAWQGLTALCVQLDVGSNGVLAVVVVLVNLHFAMVPLGVDSSQVHLVNLLANSYLLAAVPVLLAVAVALAWPPECLPECPPEPCPWLLDSSFSPRRSGVMGG